MGDQMTAHTQMWAEIKETMENEVKEIKEVATKKCRLCQYLLYVDARIKETENEEREHSMDRSEETACHEYF